MKESRIYSVSGVLIIINSVFSDDIFTELVKNYDRKHIVVIEEMLKEMHDSSDYSIYLEVISLMCIQAAGNR